MSHKSYTPKNGRKKRPLSRVYDIRYKKQQNDTKYAMSEVSQNKSPETRCEMKYTDIR